MAWKTAIQYIPPRMELGYQYYFVPMLKNKETRLIAFLMSMVLFIPVSTHQLTGCLGTKFQKQLKTI